MYWGLDTISGIAVHTAEGRSFYPDTRVLGIRDGYLLLTQDVTGSEEFDYEDAPPEADLLTEGGGFAFPLAPYRIHRIPLADVLRLDTETLAEDDEDSLTAMALAAIGASLP
jgi:hypothetical protein